MEQVLQPSLQPNVVCFCICCAVATLASLDIDNLLMQVVCDATTEPLIPGAPCEVCSHVACVPKKPCWFTWRHDVMGKEPTECPGVDLDVGNNRLTPKASKVRLTFCLMRRQMSCLQTCLHAMTFFAEPDLPNAE